MTFEYGRSVEGGAGRPGSIERTRVWPQREVRRSFKNVCPKEDNRLEKTPAAHKQKSELEVLEFYMDCQRESPQSGRGSCVKNTSPDT